MAPRALDDSGQADGDAQQEDPEREQFGHDRTGQSQFQNNQQSRQVKEDRRPQDKTALANRYQAKAYGGKVLIMFHRQIETKRA